MTTKSISIVIKAIDQATSVMRGVMKGILGVGDTTNKAAANLDKMVSGMSAIRSVVMASTAAFASFKIAADITGTAKELQRIGNLAADMGVTAEAISALQYQAKLSNAAFEGVAAGMKHFNKEMGEFLQKGKSDGMTGLRQLGINAFDAEGKLRTLDNMLPDLAERFAAIQDPVARVTIATNLFGKQGTEMARVLGQGKERLEQLRVEAEKLGGINTDKQVRAAMAYMDALDRIKTAWMGVKATLLEKIGPILAEAMTSFASIVAAVPELVARAIEVATKIGTDPEITRQFGVAMEAVHRLVDVTATSIARTVMAMVTTIVERGPSIIVDSVWIAVRGVKYAMLWLVNEVLVTQQNTAAKLLEITIGTIEGIRAAWNNSWTGGFLDGFYNSVASTLNGIINIANVFSAIVIDAFKAPFVMMEKQLMKVDKAISAVMNMTDQDWGTAVKALGDAFTGAITAPWEMMSDHMQKAKANFSTWGNQEFIPLVKSVANNTGTDASTAFWKAFHDASDVAKVMRPQISDGMTEIADAVKGEMEQLATQINTAAPRLWKSLSDAIGPDSLLVTTASNGMKSIRIEAGNTIEMMDKLFKVSEIIGKHKIELPEMLKRRSSDDNRNPPELVPYGRTEWNSENFTRGFSIGMARFIDEANNAMQIGVRFAETVGNSLTNNITNGIIDVVQGVKSIADAFKATAAAVLNEIAKMITQMLVMRAVAGIFSAFGFGGGSLAIPDTGIFGPPMTKALGGPIYPRPWGMANGGVPGAVPGANALSRDMVHALLMPGEHVMSRQGVRTAGRDVLDGYNQGRAPRAEGGTNVHVTINQVFNGKMDDEGRRQSAADTKRAVLDAVVDALATHPSGRDRMRRALA